MSKKVAKTLAFAIVMGALILNACAPAATPAPAVTTQIVEVEVTRIVQGTPETIIITQEPQVTEAPAVELPESIVVGILEPLTGAHAVFGEEAKIGIEIAAKHINEGGGIQSMGGLQIELVTEDAGEDADSARLGAESIISKHHPVAILGLYISRMTAAAAEVTDREKVILVADALVDSVTQSGRRYLFRPAPKASAHGATAVNFVMDVAKTKGVEIDTVAIINEDSAFGRANTFGALNAAINNGLTTVYQKEYPYDITDASALVNEIYNSGADFVVQCPYFNDGIVFAKAFSDAKKIPLFISGMGASGFTDPQSIEALGAIAEGYTNTYSYNPAKDTPQNNKFVEEFTAQTGHIPTEAAGMNYYGMWILKEALEKSGEMFPDDPLNPENLRSAFLALDLTSGPAIETYPAEHIKFDGAGDNPDAFAVVLQVQNGEPKVVWPLAGAEAEVVFPRADTTR
jgi:branched-chain amino acid transport system substrate-binding protein